MKMLWLFLIFPLFWTLGDCLMNLSNVTSLVIGLMETSDLQMPYYSIMVCGPRAHRFLLSLLLEETRKKKFFLVKSPRQTNVSDWNVSYDPQGFILDMDCPNSEDIIRQASDLNLLRNPYSWLLLGRDKLSSEGGDTELALSSSKGITSYLYGLEKLYPRLDSLLVIASKLSETRVEMIEVYRIRKNMSLIINDYGYWTPGGSIIRKSEKVTALRRIDLNGTTITGSIVLSYEKSRSLLHSAKDKHLDGSARLTFRIVEGMSIVLNTKLNMLFQPSWGGATPNGSWDGMVGDLVMGNADVGACPLYITPARSKILDYLLGMPYARTAFIATSPPLSYSKNLFALPFSKSVWVASVVLAFITTIVLYTTAKFESKFNEEGTDGEKQGTNWSDIALLNIGAICQQGSEFEMKGVSGRIVTLVLFLAIMFLYISYSASIVALLQSSDTSIRTMKDLLDSPLGCGAEEISYHRVWLKAATEPVRKELYKRKLAPKGEETGNYLTLAEGIERVRQGLFAFHVEVSPGYLAIQKTFTESEKCGLQELPSFIQASETWIPMQKRSPFAEHFKIAIKIAKERGVESSAVRLLLTSKPPCSQPGSKFVSVGLVDSYHLFLILTYGIVSSVVLLAIERLVQMRLKRGIKDMEATWVRKVMTDPTISNHLVRNKDN